MKKIILLTMLAFSSISMAGEWSNISFPKKEPVYHSISKMSEEKSGSLTFSCGADFNELLLLSVQNGSFEEKEGSFSITSSEKDKKNVIINGQFYLSADGTANLLIGEKKEKILYEMKRLHGIKIDFKDPSGNPFKKLSYSLKGSSKYLNIQEKKCNSFKK